MPDVLLELVALSSKNEYIAVVIMNRPAAKNALNKSLSLNLARILGELRQRQDVRVVILMGSGNCFCAGKPLACEGCIRSAARATERSIGGRRSLPNASGAHRTSRSESIILMGSPQQREIIQVLTYWIRCLPIPP
jgi:hypothetical protein